jgi:hypothetical protein
VAQKRVGGLQRRLGEGKLLFFQLFELLYPNFVLLVSGFLSRACFSVLPSDLIRWSALIQSLFLQMWAPRMDGVDGIG